jgi:hypothetical protein
MARGSGTVVDHLPHYTKVESLSPAAAAGTGSEKLPDSLNLVGSVCQQFNHKNDQQVCELTKV